MEEQGYNPSPWVPATEGPEETDVPAEVRPFLPEEGPERSEIHEALASEPAPPAPESVDPVEADAPKRESVDPVDRPGPEAPFPENIVRVTPESRPAEPADRSPLQTEAAPEAAPLQPEAQAAEPAAPARPKYDTVSQIPAGQGNATPGFESQIDATPSYPQGTTLAEIVDVRSGVEPEPEKHLIPPEGPRGPDVELPNPRLDRWRERREQREEAIRRRTEIRQHGSYQGRVEAARSEKEAKAKGVKPPGDPQPAARGPSEPHKAGPRIQMPPEMQRDFEAANGMVAQGAPALPIRPDDGGLGQMDALVGVANKILASLKAIEGKLDLTAKWNK